MPGLLSWNNNSRYNPISSTLNFASNIGNNINQIGIEEERKRQAEAARQQAIAEQQAQQQQQQQQNTPQQTKKSLDQLVQQNMPQAMVDAQKGENWFERNLLDRKSNEKIAQQLARTRASKQFQEQNNYTPNQTVTNYNAQTQQMASQDPRGLLEKGIEGGADMVQGIEDPFIRTGTAIGNLMAQPAIDQARQARLNLQNTLAQTTQEAGQKMNDTSLPLAERQRWRNVFNNSIGQAGKTYNQAQNFEKNQEQIFDPYKGAAAVGELGLDLLSASQLSPELAGGRLAGGAAVRTAAENLAKRQAAKSALARFGANVAKNAGIGAAYGGLGTVESEGVNTNFNDLLKNAAIGGAIGGAVPVGVAGVCCSRCKGCK